ncbi:MAG: septum formation inhibitor Maf [Methylomonas sp.]|nr:septum formation inhibitor Maf [Methylomonas sp.]PPD22849.1 MAG: septum formation protein Maf [Methylomonas sp.]PPD25384.1 MAG: septum formation protein Maf [Methylomonas sp.]PPD35400.1 MAG: septum formation protein Maf [Methylomonas sp.]PPD41828.1 MAG: septum formation protein Maf [Methylomonas sp.]
MQQAQIILASTSPRRSELLNQIGIAHVIHAVDIDETPLPHEAALAYVERIAAEKSAAYRALRDKSCDDTLPVLAADTAVVVDGKIFGKPRDKSHAIDMLSQLSGRSHQVYSAISLRGTHHGQAISISEVRFRPLTANEIIAYWQTGEPQGKAGAYAIQGLGSVFIETINGSFSGIMGLPLYETAQLLAQQGIRVIA